MGLILQKTFEGSHMWIKVSKDVKLDCMFFTATSEKLDNSKPDMKYK